VNRNLFYFSVILILAGLFFGIYLIAFVGFLLLLPALLATPRPPAQPSPTPAKEAPRRIIPPTEKKPEAAPLGQSMPTTAPPPVVMMPQSYSPALFPTPLMPSLSQMGMGYATQMAKETPPTRPEGRDELVEVGTLLALLKLAFG
jgi:hypothetical protein